MGSPRASSAVEKTVAAAGEAAATARPIPTVCDPWPGNTRAKLVMSSVWVGGSCSGRAPRPAPSAAEPFKSDAIGGP